MRVLRRPGLWAIALAGCFAWTIGGPQHTLQGLPGDDPGPLLDAAFVDEPLLLGAAENGGDPALVGAVPVLAQARAGEGATDGIASIELIGAVPEGAAAEGAQDAVGGPTEAEAAFAGQARPVVTYYTVRRGETLSEIAQKFHISPLTILAANDLVNPNTIQQGQRLRILSQDGAIHEVKSGESLWEIARTYRVDLDEIVTVNAIENPNRIRPAQELVIPGVAAAEIGSSLRSERLVSADGRLLPMFDWPVTGRISSNWGMRWGRMHHGLDIAVNTGTPVRAAARGRVTFSGVNGGYGNLVIIDHGDGVETRYAHNSRLLVKVGETVSRGQVIAYSGNTGNSTGPHLHFEIRYKGRSVDPRSYLR